MKYFILIFTLIIAQNTTKAQDLQTFFKSADSFFKANVFQGKVAYAKIHEAPEQLNTILKQAEDLAVSKEEVNNYKAFWINAYNLLVIKGLIDYYPVNSPLDIAGFFDKKTYKISGKLVTLNHIEHTLLRAEFKDPRFHFVLVCGAVGCPPLINNAYLPQTLDSQLTTQTQKAINGDFLRVDVKKKRVYASQIMEWYKEDFTMNGATEIDFINIYKTEKLVGKWKLSYFPYNWNINKQ